MTNPKEEALCNGDPWFRLYLMRPSNIVIAYEPLAVWAIGTWNYLKVATSAQAQKALVDIRRTYLAGVVSSAVANNIKIILQVYYWIRLLCEFDIETDRPPRK